MPSMTNAAKTDRVLYLTALISHLIEEDAILKKYFDDLKYELEQKGEAIYKYKHDMTIRDIIKEQNIETILNCLTYEGYADALRDVTFPASRALLSKREFVNLNKELDGIRNNKVLLQKKGENNENTNRGH